MSTRSGACVWWSNARDRADRGGLPRRGVTSRNYTGSCCCHRAVGRLAALLSTTRAAVAASTSGISCGPFAGGSGRGNRGSSGFSLESFAGALPPPPRGSGKSPGNSQGSCRVPRFAALDLGASRNLVDSTGLLNVTAEIGLGGPPSTYATIRFALGGMVFSDTVAAADLTSNDHENIGVRSGGDVGDAYVSFIASRRGTTDAADPITLMIDQLGVKPGVPGSVTMTVTDTLGPEKYTASHPNAVRTMRALEEKAMANDLKGHR